MTTEADRAETALTNGSTEQDEAVRALVRRTTAKQGLPERLNDPSLLADVARLLGEDEQDREGAA